MFSDLVDLILAFDWDYWDQTNVLSGCRDHLTLQSEFGTSKVSLVVVLESETDQTASPGGI